MQCRSIAKKKMKNNLKKVIIGIGKTSKCNLVIERALKYENIGADHMKTINE